MNRMIDQVADVTSTRRNMNGKPLLNFLRVAIHWMDYLANLGKPIVLDPENVCYMMELFKMARQENTFQDDNILDGIGYLDCLDAIHRQMKEMGYLTGAEHLRDMSKAQLEALRDTLVAGQCQAKRVIAAFEATRKQVLDMEVGVGKKFYPPEGLKIKYNEDGSGTLTWAEQRRQRITRDNGGYHGVITNREGR